jgi:hypothetical protein
LLKHHQKCQVRQCAGLGSRDTEGTLVCWGCRVCSMVDSRYTGLPLGCLQAYC